ncbi:MAG: Ig-like domain-containing protein [Thermoanaerobaculia bacterium]|nr:Ig-like domain-containing protein [Thermoanaerobaculia bacterium]
MKSTPTRLRRILILAALLASPIHLLGEEEPRGTAPEVRPAALSVTARTPSTIDTLSFASDRDGDVLDVSLVYDNCLGQVTDRADGTFVFTPMSDTAETCEIHYQVSDREMQTNGTIDLRVLAAGSGTPVGSPPTGNGAVPGYDPENEPRRFRRQGQLLDVVGYYPGLHALTRGHNIDDFNHPAASSYYVHLFDTLADAEVNYMRTVLTINMAMEVEPWMMSAPAHDVFLHPYRRATGAGTCCTEDATINGLSRHRFDLDQFAPEFFSYWDAVIQQAEARGIVLQLAFFEARHTWGNDSQGGWEGGYHVDGIFYRSGRRYDYFAGGNNVNGVDSEGGQPPVSAQGWYAPGPVRERQKAFVREAVRRLGHHTNIVWEIANEPWQPASGYQAWLDDLAATVRTAEADHEHPHHLVMPIDLPEHRDVKGHMVPGDNEGSIGDFRNFHHAMVTQYASAATPLISDNDCCQNNGNRDQKRWKAWTTVVSGGDPLLFDFKADEVVAQINQRLDDIGDVGRVATILRATGIDRSQVVPDDGAVVPGADMDAWALADRGEEYLVYLIERTPVRIPDLPPHYRATWYDPRTGDATMAELDENGTFMAERSGDWVLHVKRTTPPAPQVQSAYPDGVPHGINVRIEAEHYDRGGEGLAYHDSDPGNEVPTDPFRPDEGVEAQILSWATVVKKTADGEWLAYTVDVPSAGRYVMRFSYSTRRDEGQLQPPGEMRVETRPAGSSTAYVPLTTFDVPVSESWEQFQSPAFDMEAGLQSVRLYFNEATYNLNWFRLNLLDALTPDPETLTAESCTEPASITVAELLEGDQPAGQVEISWIGDGSHGTTTADGDLLSPTTHVLYQPGANFCAEGSDSFRYRIRHVDDGGLDAEGTVTVLAPIHAADDVIDAPAGSTCDQTPRIIPISALLANDIPRDELEIVTAGAPLNGTLTLPPDLGADGAELTFTPSSGFCAAGSGSFEYTVARIDDPTVQDSASVSVLAPVLPPPEANDDEWTVWSCSAPDSIRFSELLQNDLPPGALEIWLVRPVAPGGSTLGTVTATIGPNRITFEPSPGFCEQGHTWFRYYVRHRGVTGGDNGIAFVKVWAPPRPPVADDGPFFTFQDRSVRIEIADLLANDAVGAVFDGIETVVLGQAVLTTDGQAILYTPPISGAPTTDTFTYAVRDGVSGRRSQAATVTVTLGGPGPLAQDDQFRLPAADAATIRVDALVANDSGQRLRLVRTSAPSQGALTVEAGSLTYVPDPGFGTVGGDTFTYTVEPADHPGFETTATVMLDAEAPCTTLRTDDFETLPFSGWDGATGVDVTTSAAATGALGLEAAISADLPKSFVIDGVSEREDHAFVRFVLDPAGLELEPHRLETLLALDDTQATVFSLRLQREAGVPQIQLVAAGGSESVMTSSWVPLRDFGQTVEVEWLAAETPTTMDGTARLWLDRRLVAEIEGLDTAGSTVDALWLGAIGGRTNAGSVLTFDDYRSCRGDRSHDLRLLEDFESDLSQWAAVGTVAITPDAALAGDSGLEVEAVPGARHYVETTLGSPLAGLRLDFGLDLDRLSMPDGAMQVLLEADHGSTEVAHVKLRFQDGRYRARLVARRDDGSLKAPNPSWIDLEGGAGQLFFEWRAGGKDSADGTARLVFTHPVLGDTIQSVTGLDNDTLLFDTLRLGALGTVDAGVAGQLAIDRVRGWRIADSPDFFVVDDFETSDLDRWSASLGDITVAPEAAFGGSALRIGVSGANAWVRDDSPSEATTYRADLTLDPRLGMSAGDNFNLVRAVDTQGRALLVVRARPQSHSVALRLQAYEAAAGGGLAQQGTHWILPNAYPARLGLRWSAEAGTAQLLLDGVVVGTLTGLAIDGLAIDRVSFGAAASTDPGTVGEVWIDDVVTGRD